MSICFCAAELRAPAHRIQLPNADDPRSVHGVRNVVVAVKAHVEHDVVVPSLFEGRMIARARFLYQGQL